MTYRFLDNREKEVSSEKLAGYSRIVVGAEATGEEEVVRVFVEDRDFRRWADGSPIGARVAAVYQTLENDMPRQQKENAEWVQQMQTLAMKRKAADFKAFAKLVGAPVNSDEVIKRAMIDRTALTPLSFDPILLWDRRIEHEPPQGGPVDARTRMMPIPTGWWPFLGWVGWDNVPRSARVFGLNFLCENPWFGGRWLCLVGFNMLLNLDRVGFDHITSSVIST